jgi:hypothetical protein
MPIADLFTLSTPSPGGAWFGPRLGFADDTGSDGDTVSMVYTRALTRLMLRVTLTSGDVFDARLHSIDGNGDEATGWGTFTFRLIDQDCDPAFDLAGQPLLRTVNFNQLAAIDIY